MIMDAGFGRQFRVTSRSEFEKIYRNGMRYDNEHFRLHILRTSGMGTPKIGIAVPKRVGNAVVRNRLKRQIREWFRKHKHEVGENALVVDVKPEARWLKFSKLSESLDALVNREKSR